MLLDASILRDIDLSHIDVYTGETLVQTHQLGAGFVASVFIIYILLHTNRFILPKIPPSLFTTILHIGLDTTRLWGNRVIFC